MEPTYNRTYTVKDASEILQISENMVEQLVNSGELRSYRIGRLIRITGAAILDFQGLTNTVNPRRTHLINLLHNTAEGLTEEIKKHNGHDLGVFLLQSINLNADEGTLSRILIDANNHLHYLREQRETQKLISGIKNKSGDKERILDDKEEFDEE